jgi:hypothetical protein
MQILSVERVLLSSVSRFALKTINNRRTGSNEGIKNNDGLKFRLKSLRHRRFSRDFTYLFTCTFSNGRCPTSRQRSRSRHDIFFTLKCYFRVRSKPYFSTKWRPNRYWPSPGKFNFDRPYLDNDLENTIISFCGQLKDVATYPIGVLLSSQMR